MSAVSRIPQKWFKDSLKFSCTACGQCCRGKTQVFLNTSEVDALSNHFGKKQYEFISQYTRDVELPSGELATSLKSKPLGKGVGCILFDEASNKCTAYEARPTGCQTYPFW
jgi:Fe-S-cluster containining protein